MPITPEEQAQISAFLQGGSPGSSSSSLSPQEQAQIQAHLAGLDVGGSTEPKGVGSHVLDFLGLFDRPRNAVATAVQEGLSDDPNASAAGGFYRGLTGQKQTSWGDVVGLNPGTADMGWGEWLGREGGRLAMDVVADPLNLLFAPAKAGKVVGGAVKALGVPEGRSIAGLAASAAKLPQAADYIERTTGLGKMFRTGTGDDVTQGIVNAAKREGATVDQFIQENQSTIAAALKEAGVPPERMVDYFAAIERKGAGLAEDLPPDILKIFDPLVQKHNELFAARNAARVAKGMEAIPSATTDSLQHIPRIRVDLPMDAKSHSRTLTRWTTEEGVEPVPGFVSSGKAEDMNARGFFKDRASGEWYHQSDPQSFVGPTKDVDIGQIYKEGAMPKGSFIEDPASALGIGIKRSQQEITYLKTLDDLEKSEKLVNLKQPKFTPDDFKQMTGPEGSIPGNKIPDGWRQLLAPGMEEYAAPWKLANWIENQAYVLDKSTSAGAIHEAIAPLFKGRVGKVYDEATQLFKRGVLAHPGWLFGNIFSNLSQMITHSEMAPWRLGGNLLDAAKVLTEKGEDVVAGISNSLLKNEFALRGIDIARGSGQYGAGEVAKAGGPGFLRRTLPEPLQFLATAAEKTGQYVIDPIFTAGNWAEQNNKLAVALDWLKQNAPDFATKPMAERASLLDKAAQVGHDALIDYDASTPFRRDVLQKVFPFERWVTGITSNTIHTALNSPQKLANLGRYYDAIFEPLSQADKSISDKWIQENAPTQGIMGTSYDAIAGMLGMDPNPAGKRMFLSGRFLPQQNLEALAKRPQDTITSMINPIPKGVYELLANRNTFKDKPIDPLAGGFPGNLLNPITGGNYSLADQKTLGTHLPAGLEYLLGQSPWGRWSNEAGTLTRGAGAWDDPYKADVGLGESALWWATGGKTFPFDAMKMQQHRGYEFTTKLRDIKSKMNYAIKKGDMDGATFYQQQYIEHLQSKPAALGMVEPG